MPAALRCAQLLPAAPRRTARCSPALPSTPCPNRCAAPCASCSAVGEVIDYMDATLSKVVLTQVRLPCLNGREADYSALAQPAPAFSDAPPHPAAALPPSSLPLRSWPCTAACPRRRPCAAPAAARPTAAPRPRPRRGSATARSPSRPAPSTRVRAASAPPHAPPAPPPSQASPGAAAAAATRLSAQQRWVLGRGWARGGESAPARARRLWQAERAAAAAQAIPLSPHPCLLAPPLPSCQADALKRRFVETLEAKGWGL